MPLPTSTLSAFLVGNRNSKKPLSWGADFVGSLGGGVQREPEQALGPGVARGSVAGLLGVLGLIPPHLRASSELTSESEGQSTGTLGSRMRGSRDEGVDWRIDTPPPPPAAVHTMHHLILIMAPRGV